MTEEQTKMVAEFEARVQQLRFLCDSLKQENANLKHTAANREILIESLTEENELLKTKYDNLKMAKIISVGQNDFSAAKKRMSDLVKEVDKCIALLNEEVSNDD
jgi:predicted PP-loop superfamily ATPase